METGMFYEVLQALNELRNASIETEAMPAKIVMGSKFYARLREDHIFMPLNKLGPMEPGLKTFCGISLELSILMPPMAWCVLNHRGELLFYSHCAKNHDRNQQNPAAVSGSGDS
jgi:hypothetical protein